ncbi:MAG: hypothetical protein WDA09_04460 [Bacteriovoracaceae bacterium]
MVRETEKIDGLVHTIAIKLPNELQLRVLSFAFLHALRSQYPSAEVHLICSKHGIEVLNLLPFKNFFYHEFDDEEIKSVFDVHRYCAGLKIYNVDLFISLSDSFYDCCLGLGLRAKKRIGYKKGLNGFVLNEVHSWMKGQHVTDNHYQLTEFNSDPSFRILSRELKPILEEDLKYIAFNVGPLSNGQIDEVWREVCSKLQNQNIVLFTDLSEDKFILNQKEFLSQLNPQNNYKFFLPENYIELSQMMAFSQGVITRNGVISCLSAYCGTPTLILNDREDPQILGPFHFMAELKYINLDFRAAGAELEKPAQFSAEEVSLSAFDFFKLYL